MYSNRTGYTVAVYPADNPGPALTQSYPRVIFRIKGENQTRVFDPRNNPTLNFLGDFVKSCQVFVDIRCRAFLSLDGYNPLDRTYKGAYVVDSEVDHFYCDHPLVVT